MISYCLVKDNGQVRLAVCNEEYSLEDWNDVFPRRVITWGAADTLTLDLWSIHA